MSAEELNEIGRDILDAAITVHRKLGPGLLESIYVHCLKKELEKRGHRVQLEVKVPVLYDGEDTGKFLCLDMLVDGIVIIEAKSVEQLIPVYTAQLLSHLRLRDAPLGYLINFNVPLLKDGFKRIVNHFPDGKARESAQSLTNSPER